MLMFRRTWLFVVTGVYAVRLRSGETDDVRSGDVELANHDPNNW